MCSRAAKKPVPCTAPKRVVLIAVTGASPAILTEAVWALAQENPPVLPDEIAIITTTDGETAEKQQLHQPRADWKGLTVWQGLRQNLLGKDFKSDPRLNRVPPTLISAPDPATGTSRLLEDIRTPQENAAAAEAIFSIVQHFARDKDCQLVGLLSGGRKTMGALLHAALSLAGRPGDRLLHVLVSPPFDHPKLEPVFYFPGQPGPGEHYTPAPDRKAIPQSAAHIDLADVPLVALGELVLSHTGQSPTSFASFSRIATAALQDSTLQTMAIRLSYAPFTRTLSLNQYTCEIPEGRSAAFCLQLLRDAEADCDLVKREALVARWKSKVRYPKPDGTHSYFTDDDISNAQNVVRESLEKDASAPKALVDRILPRRSEIGFNREGIRVKLTE